MGEIVVHTIGISSIVLKKVCTADKVDALKLLDNAQKSMLEKIQETNDLLDLMKMVSPDDYETALEMFAKDNDNEDWTSP